MPIKSSTIAKGSTSFPSPPQGVASPPQGVAEGTPEFYNWLAHQPVAAREWYIEGRYNAIAGKTDPTSRKKAAWSEQDKLQAAQEAALAKGETLPDVDPRTGQGIHFSSKDQETEFYKHAAISTGAQNLDQANAITPEQVTINPTYIPTDEAAAHPENVIAHYGPAGQEQVDQEQAAFQTPSDTTGLDAQKQALQDYTQAIDQGGLTAIDRARLAESQMRRGMETRAAEAAIMQRAEQQGRAGSAASLVAKQQALQGSENLQSQEAMQTGALGLARKDAFMQARGTLGGQIQGAQDVRDHFNTQGQRDVEHANAIAKNAAHHGDIAAERDVNKGNVDITNSALSAGMGYRTGVNAGNTDIANTAEGANKGPGYGARGLLTAKEGAAGPVIGGQLTGAGLTQDKAIADAAAKAQNDALTWNAIGTLTGAGVGVAKAAYGK